MASEKDLSQAMDWVRKAVKPLKGFRVMTEKPFASRLQALLARGDEAVFGLAELAAQPGMSWKKALKAWDGDASAYLDRERGADEAFPWECIDIGAEWANGSTLEPTDQLPQVNPPPPEPQPPLPDDMGQTGLRPVGL